MSHARRSFWVFFPFLVVGLASLIYAISYYLQGQLSTFDADRSSISNLGFFLLINLNIVVVMVLGFLVVKNVVKLVLDRRRKILGTKLRGRLVAAFVGLSLIPTVLMLLVARGIVGNVLQGWFSPQIASSVDGALEVAKYHYDGEEQQLTRQIALLSDSLSKLSPFLMDYSSEKSSGEISIAQADKAYDALLAYLELKRREYGLTEIAIVDWKGEVVTRVSSTDPSLESIAIPAPNISKVFSSLEGNVSVAPEQSINGEFLRGYGPLTTSLLGGIVGEGDAENEVIEAGAQQQRSAEYVVVSTLQIPSALNSLLAEVIGAYDDYKELSSYRRPLASSYTLTLVGVTLMIVFAAIWVGFYLAKSLSVPIQLLAEGTEQVAHGNLQYRIPTVGDDELGVLVSSFNQMTTDLEKTTGELVEGRRYMETVLENVGVGVISVDKHSRITTCNISAAEMLQLKNVDEIREKPLDAVLSEAIASKVSQMLEELYRSPDKVIASNASLEIGGHAKHVQVTVTKLLSEQDFVLGAVILIDDFTELVSAQRMAAWREVARRIAHEIKNPLTPIQLSAQRMQRRLSRSTEPLSENERELVHESTETIVSQVETLRTLVNEFSKFARMPKAVLRPVEINEIIQETGGIYRQANPRIQFEIETDQRVPLVDVDRDQIGRALINLIDNAVASVQSSTSVAPSGDETKSREESTSNGFLGKIGISSHFDEDLGLVSLRVDDDGLGISDKDKSRLFEPYFSTKKGGTGLGLAIVSSIVADHNGFVRVRDNEPNGAAFIIELPARMRKAANESN